MAYRLWSSSSNKAVGKLKIQESGSSSVHKAGCLSCSSVNTGVPKQHSI